MIDLKVYDKQFLQILEHMKPK
jgi:hypothetical protein